MSKVLGWGPGKLELDAVEADALSSSVTLDERSPVLFLSDLHFGDGSATDLFGGQSDRLVSFLEEQRQRVQTIVFLGDIFDMPQAWSTSRIYAAHGDVIAYVAELARAQDVVFVRGNHDWSVDYEAHFPGSIRRDAVLIGERILAWHGHQVDLLMNPRAQHATAKTYVHAILERVVRRRLVPPLERHDSTANRVALTLAVAWARVTMARAHRFRRLGKDESAALLEDRVRYLTRSVHGDPADIFRSTDRRLLGDRFDTVVCGHTHTPGIARTSRGTYVNTGTWASGMRTCAIWTGERFRVLDVDTHTEIEDEHYAGVPDDSEPDELFEWWWQTWRESFGRTAGGLGSVEAS